MEQYKKATRINRAIRCRNSREWFATEDIDLDAFIFFKNGQSSAILSEMVKDHDLLDRKPHPEKRRAFLYRKKAGANAFLDARIKKSSFASKQDILDELESAINLTNAEA